MKSLHRLKLTSETDKRLKGDTIQEGTSAELNPFFMEVLNCRLRRLRPKATISRRLHISSELDLRAAPPLDEAYTPFDDDGATSDDHCRVV